MRNRPQIAPSLRTARGRLGGVACLAALAALAGCEPYVEGNGVLGEQQRAVAAFGGLAIADGIQAAVAAGAVERTVVVRGDENVLEFITTRVEERAPHGPVLVVDTSETQYLSTNPLQVLVGAPSFAYVRAEDASPVTVTGAAAEVFTVEAIDGSSVALAGAGGARLVAALGGGQHGGARLEARAYPVAEADVVLSGGASAALDASSSVEGTADGAGTRLENEGAGVCEVAITGGAELVCAAP